ncbi:ABC transporter ATP-binding protein [Listeria floridensis FSL S10-1187]|uniref:ABC transporter ATP-binding protein n=1 Tax=Listeria floridensis FSL S10-1187 TaxID=1265817 RepID=A0ABP3AXD0_9LIST|nr:ABC transporter ATP-binding protein [Listeria floridensis]EUJ26934.1 ABC transporter ATP-binding protein [Listeria floridensis FSL S10-1187]
MIQIRDLEIVTREKLIEKGSFQFHEGMIYGLSAPNGSGKTTLLRVIAGLTAARNGEIYFEQEGIRLNRKEIAQRLFYYETTEWLDKNLSALDYLKFVGKMWHHDVHQLHSIIHFWEMEEFVRLPIRKYSLGMKQKTVLAMYAYSHTDYWLMDEPTNGLDTVNQERFIQFVKEAKEKGKTVIFSSHLNDQLYAITDETIYIMQQQLMSSKDGWRGGHS